MMLSILAKALESGSLAKWDFWVQKPKIATIRAQHEECPAEGIKISLKTAKGALVPTLATKSKITANRMICILLNAKAGTASASRG